MQCWYAVRYWYGTISRCKELGARATILLNAQFCLPTVASLICALPRDCIFRAITTRTYNSHVFYGPSAERVYIYCCHPLPPLGIISYDKETLCSSVFLLSPSVLLSPPCLTTRIDLDNCFAHQFPIPLYRSSPITRQRTTCVRKACKTPRNPAKLPSTLQK